LKIIFLNLDDIKTIQKISERAAEGYRIGASLPDFGKLAPIFIVQLGFVPSSTTEIHLFFFPDFDSKNMFKNPIIIRTDTFQNVFSPFQTFEKAIKRVIFVREINQS